jgi:hypothetical protein
MRKRGVSDKFRPESAPKGKNNEYAILSNEVNGARKAPISDNTPISDYCASLLAADIALELLDDELLFSDDGLDEIADGNHTTYFASLDNRQMANPYLGH